VTLTYSVRIHPEVEQMRHSGRYTGISESGPNGKSLGGEYERSGSHYLLSFPSEFVLPFFHPRGLCERDHPTSFSFLETSRSFSRRPVRQSPFASRDVLPTGPPNKAVLANRERQSGGKSDMTQYSFPERSQKYVN
jgi:hypothetical protein